MRANRRVLFLALGFSLFLAAAPLLAHHSFMGEFDLTKVLTLKGTIVDVDWGNPHITFKIDVKDEKGALTRWSLESASPGALVRRGWSRDDLKFGELITVECYAAKKGATVATTKSVTFPNGRKLLAESDGVRPD